MTRLPEWLRKKTPKHFYQEKIRKTLNNNQLYSVCEEAKCPNRGECFAKQTMTFMILGNICTRSCLFCGVAKSGERSLNQDEPYYVAEAVQKLGIKHAVITSVTRDDLIDGGVSHFKRTVEVLRKFAPECTIEILTPDFLGKEILWSELLSVEITVFNHNVETIPRLYHKIRPQADYQRSLNMLKYFKKHSNFKIKSGMMLGFGESVEEVQAVLKDLKNSGCDIVTIGQYLQPSKNNIPVAEYILPKQFKEYEKFGERLSLHVYSGPWVRSSYNASEIVAENARLMF